MVSNDYKKPFPNLYNYNIFILRFAKLLIQFWLAPDKVVLPRASIIVMEFTVYQPYMSRNLWYGPCHFWFISLTTIAWSLNEDVILQIILTLALLWVYVHKLASES